MPPFAELTRPHGLISPRATRRAVIWAHIAGSAGAGTPNAFSVDTLNVPCDRRIDSAHASARPNHL
jgi:hypothetical protein